MGMRRWAKTKKKVEEEEGGVRRWEQKRERKTSSPCRRCRVSSPTSPRTVRSTGWRVPSPPPPSPASDPPGPACYRRGGTGSCRRSSPAGSAPCDGNGGSEGGGEGGRDNCTRT